MFLHPAFEVVEELQTDGEVVDDRFVEKFVVDVLSGEALLDVDQPFEVVLVVLEVQVQTLIVLHLGVHEVEGERDEGLQVDGLRAADLSGDQFLLQNALRDVEDDIGHLGDFLDRLGVILDVGVNRVDHGTVTERLDELLLHLDVLFQEQPGQLVAVRGVVVHAVLRPSLFHPDHDHVVLVRAVSFDLHVRFRVRLVHDVLIPNLNILPLQDLLVTL